MISVANQVEETRDVDTALSALARAWVGDDRERVRSALARALGAEPGGVEPQEVFWAVRQFVAHVARDRPLICAFDDLHWAEPMLLDLIELVVDQSSDVPLLVVCAARPELLELRPAWAGGKPNATTMLLEPLPDSAIEELVRVLSSASPLSDAARARIVEAADGLPLYVEELLRMLSDGGDSAAADAGTLRAPPSLEAIVSARLERLDAADRSVLEHASVIGRSFERSALVNLLPDEREADVDGRLDLLVRRELVRREGSGGAGYRFRHHLVRDAAYASLPKSDRASLHRRVADWLATQGGDGLLELRGYHLAEAHRYLTDLRAPDAEREAVAREAAGALAAAGRQAFARHNSAAAHALLGRAAGLLPEADEERLRAELVLAEVLRQRGDLRGAATLLDDVRARAEDAALPAVTARAEIFGLWLRGSVEPRGWVAAVDELGARLEPGLTAARDDEGLALLWGIRLDAAMAGAEVAGAERAAEQVLAHAGQSGDAWQVSRRARATLGEMAVVDGDPIPVALEACRSLLEAGAGDRRLESQLLASVTRLQAMAGDEAAAADSGSRAIAAADELSLLYAGAFARQAAAFAARLAGRPEDAVALVAEGRTTLERRGDFRAAVSLGLDEVELLLELGRADEARQRLAAIGDPDAVDDPRLTAHLAGLTGIAEALAASAERAMHQCQVAVDVSTGTGSPVWLARAEGHRAVALVALGRDQEARAAGGRAVAALERKQAPALVAHLTRLVEAAVAAG